MIEERVLERWGWWMRMTAMAAIIASGGSREDGYGGRIMDIAAVMARFGGCGGDSRDD
jgi:hypothetical protein